VPSIAKLGSRVIAVSGDHDSHQMMLALARTGVTILTSHGRLRADGRFGPAEITVEGLRVAGFEDPMEYDGVSPDDRGRIFSFGQLPDAKVDYDGPIDIVDAGTVGAQWLVRHRHRLRRAR
jgi:hypothetical protein